MSIYKGEELISPNIANAADKSLSNLDVTGQAIIDSKADVSLVNTKVSKSGDTMSGVLTISNSNNPAMVIQDNNIDLTVTPSATNYGGLEFHDVHGSRHTKLEPYKGSDGSYGFNLNVMKSGGGAYASLGVNFSSAGVASCSFPNTTCCDGQWVAVNTQIADDANVNGSSPLSYTLALPSDGRNYEVLIVATMTTGKTSGNTVSAMVSSDIMNNVTMARTRTRAAATMNGAGSAIIRVSSSHKIYLARSTDYTGTVSLFFRGYRRIGTNG